MLQVLVNSSRNVPTQGVVCQFLKHAPTQDVVFKFYSLCWVFLRLQTCQHRSGQGRATQISATISGTRNYLFKACLEFPDGTTCMEAPMSESRLSSTDAIDCGSVGRNFKMFFYSKGGAAGIAYNKSAGMCRTAHSVHNTIMSNIDNPA